MKWLSRLSALVFGLITIGTVKEFFSKNRILIISDEVSDIEFDEEDEMNINDLKPDYQSAMDLRGLPTHLCACGCNIWNLKVIFQNFEIATYFLDMECANCGSLATAPTPVDREETDL